MSEAQGKGLTPSRSDQQRREALARANQVRSARRCLKEQLKRREASLASLIDNYPSYLATAKVNDLLQALPGWGPARAGKLLASCHISPTKTVAGLTPRQRQAFLETLTGWVSL